MEKETKENEINRKEIRKKIYKMILPITLESVMQMSAGFVSAAYIGRMDAVVMSALGVSNRITQLIWAFFKGITTGSSVFVAQAYGAKDEKKISKVIVQTMISCIILVIILAAWIRIKAEMFLGIFNSSQGVLREATGYLKIAAFGLPFVVIMLLVASSLQGMGDGKTPMKIAAVMNGVNILVSPVFIFGKLGMPAMGLKGAALGLIIAQFVGAMLGIYTLFNKKKGILKDVKLKEDFKIDIKQIVSIYKVGFPSSLESMCWQFASIIVTTLTLGFGETVMAAYNMGLQAESISYMPAVGFSVAATAFTGQALGAKNKELGKIYMKEIFIGSTILTVICSAALLLFPGSIMRLLTNKQDVVSLGSVYLILMGLVQIPQNTSSCLNGALRGAGYTRIPMYCAGIGIWIVRIPLALLFTLVLKLNVVAIWSAMCVDLVVRLIVSIVFYKKYKIFSKESKNNMVI